jgi:hypothetical protein
MSIVVLPALIPEANHVSPDVYINAQVTAECAQSIDSKQNIRNKRTAAAIRSAP